MTSIEFKQIRESANMAQWDVANRLGVCQATVSLWEKARKPIPENIAEMMKEIGGEK